MKLYVCGKNNDMPCLVTIEPVEGFTDLSGLTSFELATAGSQILHCPFYLQCPLNCGKITAITDVLEQSSLPEAELSVFKGKETHKVQLGQCFLVKDYDYAEGKCLMTYRYKVAALEDNSYVSETFNGFKYSHYSNGAIAYKVIFKTGAVQTIRGYRNDVYNTLRQISLFKDNQIYAKYDYDAEERLTGRHWYKSDGTEYLPQDGQGEQGEP